MKKMSLIKKNLDNLSYASLRYQLSERLSKKMTNSKLVWDKMSSRLAGATFETLSQRKQKMGHFTLETLLNVVEKSVKEKKNRSYKELLFGRHKYTQLNLKTLKSQQISNDENMNWYQLSEEQV